MEERIIKSAVFLLLFINGILDWKKGEISLASLGAFGAAGIGLNMWLDYQSFFEVAGGIGLGILLLVTAFFTREAIGFGDGLLLCVTGIYLGFWENLNLLFLGAVCSDSGFWYSGRKNKAGRSGSAGSLFTAGIYGEVDFVREKLKKGSFTVEASMLIPFLILILFVFLCLCLYLHDRSVLSSCAAELAGKGAAEKYQTEKELEAWLQGQAAGLARGKLLCLRETEAAVKVTKQKITVSYMGRTGLLGGLTAKEEEQAARLNPTKRLRSIRELKKL